MSDARLVFVYGTLKRGGSNHGFLLGQTFLGEAQTLPGFQLYRLNGYPGMIASSADSGGVTGEVWNVDAATLAQLDELEGLAEGLYRREAVPLLAPFADRTVEAYLYARPLGRAEKIGSTWLQ